MAKRVPRGNREGKRSLCENLTSSPTQTGRNLECPKLWAEGVFCAQVRSQVWQIGYFDDISPAGCRQVVKAGQLQRGVCLLLVVGGAEADGQAQGSDWPALPCSRLPGLFLTAASWTKCSLWNGRGPVGRKRCREGAL